MKKAKKIQYGIEITKPWSKEMYNHNEAVAQVVYEMVLNMWEDALTEALANFDDDGLGYEFEDLPWDEASQAMLDIQRAITCYSFGFGYDVAKVSARVKQELEDAPLYRLNEIVDELKLDIKVGFVGFS